MKNMKVSLKLITSFTIVILLAACVGAFGIIGMYLINAADDALYENNYLPTVMAGNISQAIVEQRVLMRNFVIYDVVLDPTEFKNAESEFNKSKTNTQNLIDEYEDTIINEKDRAAFNEFVKAYSNEWLPIIEKLHNLGSNNQTEEAKDNLTSAAATAAKLIELTTTLQNVNLDDGQMAVDRNSRLFATMTTVEVVLLLIAVAVAAYLVIYISSLISKPLVTMVAFLSHATTTGDLNFRPEDKENIAKLSTARDEIGVMTKSLAGFIDRVVNVSNALETIANNDLTAEVKLLSDSDIMGISLQKMTTNLNRMFNEINTASSQVSTAARQISDGAQSLAQGTTEQAASTEQLSSSISEVASQTKDNADMALHASELGDTIRSNAQKGSGQMERMTTAVREINEASQSIGKIIKVIDDIAFQTNILALNAAVEAARAGQHGKGFAVVAEEVRNLAAKSAEAAKSTSEIIESSIQKAEMGVSIADETAASLSDIVEGINESSQIVSTIAESSNAQSAAISQINQGVSQVAQVVQTNSATAEQSAAASQEMRGQADMLQALVAQFKLKDAAGVSTRSVLAIPEKTAPRPVGRDGDFGKY